MQGKGLGALTQRWSRLPLAAACAALVAASLAGCGSPRPSRADLADALHERYGLSRTQAACVADHLFAKLSTSDLRRLRKVQQTALLPPQIQRRYQRAVDSAQRACGP